MITVEELKAKFPVRNVAPHGDCIIIPGDQFDPDWEVFLGDQGYKCFFIDLDRKPVTLVRLKPLKGTGSMALRDRLERRWSFQEDEFLMELWNQKPQLNIPEIAKKVAEKYPTRSENAVKMRLDRLKTRGKIKLRLSRLGRPKKNESALKISDKVIGIKPAGPEPATPTPSSTPADTPPSHTPPSTLKALEDSPVLVKLLKEILDSLKPKSLCFDYACQHCNYLGNADDEERIWRFCPVCGKPLIVWNVEAFS